MKKSAQSQNSHRNIIPNGAEKKSISDLALLTLSMPTGREGTIELSWFAELAGQRIEGEGVGRRVLRRSEKKKWKTSRDKWKATKKWYNEQIDGEAEG